MTVDENAKIIWEYMQLGNDIKRADAIFVLCSHDTRVAARGAELFLDGYGEWLIFSGGFGTITTQRFAIPEARLFADIAVKLGVPAEKIIIEDASTNTGENIRFTYRLLQEKGLNPHSLILVQKPYMERRTYATFKKQWPDPTTIIGVTSPQISYENYFTTDVSKDDVINIMVGDLERIKEYPKLGYQIEQDIPDKVWQAYEALVAAGYDKHLISDPSK